MIAPSNGNGSHNNCKKTVGVPFKSGAEWNGNAGGRPKGTKNVSTMLREVLEDGGEEAFKAGVKKLLMNPDSEANMVKVMELFRKAIDGDKLTVADVESIEWSVDAEESSPVPASLETNRLPQRGES